jgi:DNA recombination-dependent growth factor C
MAALSGALGYARFFVPDAMRTPKAQRKVLDAAHAAIRLRAMRPLTADESDAERSGWCVLGEPLDTSMPAARVFLDGYVNLGFRTDRWAIPGPLLRAKLREAEAAHLARTGRERLGRAERAELKDFVVRELRKKLVPSTRAVDLSWSLDEGVVRFFSHAAKTTAAMLDLFEKTFGFELVAESPYTLAQRLVRADEDRGTWEALEPTLLTRPHAESPPAPAARGARARGGR